jgi:hypothetical protein
MPLVRINLSRNASPQTVRAVSDTVYEAMINVANVAREDWSFGNGEMQYAPKA